MSLVIQGAVGLVFNPEGQILMAKRQAWQHQPNTWEFPGGKMEPGETAAMALKRELYEEVGIMPTSISEFMQVPFEYPDKSVLLHVQKVSSFTGEAFGKENQLIKWVDLNTLKQYSVPLANEVIVDKILSANF